MLKKWVVPETLHVLEIGQSTKITLEANTSDNGYAIQAYPLSEVASMFGRHFDF